MIFTLLETVGGNPTALSRQMHGLGKRLAAERGTTVQAWQYPVDGPFLARPIADAAIRAIEAETPEAVLLAATPTGKMIAPRLAAHFATGLAADCNAFGWSDDGNLLQTRPAFGGMVRAQIVTAHARPQLATVRENVFPDDMEAVEAQPLLCKKADYTQILSVAPLPPQEDIAAAFRLVAVGGGLRDKSDLDMVREAAGLLGAELACSRVIVARGWLPQSRQIGLSGRAVRPKLLLTLGISGSMQFMAGAAGADRIVAVSDDPAAPIFAHAALSICADLYDVLPALIKRLR